MNKMNCRISGSFYIVKNGNTHCYSITHFIKSKVSLSKISTVKVPNTQLRFPRNLLASQKAGNLNFQRAFVKNIDNKRNQIIINIEIMC
ncbi:hypothetical protein Glove_122g130 [Diversispora epigaea]|uniref:Uncharacterized protein n=1 Tax=Diversispora epigaea TaxID=1348612 RepID=A0A397J7Z2_9GLOM|nr:hypothetical protein Glove_122g130 [Diversispora epigaea]